MDDQQNAASGGGNILPAPAAPNPVSAALAQVPGSGTVPGAALADVPPPELDIAVVPVRDLSAAKKFYENTLSLHVDAADEKGVQYSYGDNRVAIYQSPEEVDADESDSIVWQVSNLEAIVDSLKSKGIAFENYDMQGVPHEGDIHVFEDGVRCVWFKDPDGNMFELDEIK